MATTIKVPQDFLRAIQLADLIIYSVKNTLKFGSGNQASANSEADIPVGDGTHATSSYPARHLTWEARELYKAGAVVAPNKDKPTGSRNTMRKAYLATRLQAGNCGEMANLAYVLCREYFGPEWTVIRASSTTMDHAFCLVYRNEDEVIDVDYAGRRGRTLGVVVVDPWPIHSQAMLWTSHFCSPKKLTLNWRRDGAFKIFNEKAALGSSVPSATAINNMTQLIAQIREGEKIEAVMDEADVLKSRRIEKYRIKPKVWKHVRGRMIKRVLVEKKRKQYDIKYGTSSDVFLKFELLPIVVEPVEERKQPAKRKRDEREAREEEVLED